MKSKSISLGVLLTLLSPLINITSSGWKGFPLQYLWIYIHETCTGRVCPAVIAPATKYKINLLNFFIDIFLWAVISFIVLSLIERRKNAK